MRDAVIDWSPELLEAQRVAATDKRYSTVRAQLALHAWELHILGGGDGKTEFQVHRWGRSQVFRDVAAVEGFARQVGAA